MMWTFFCTMCHVDVLLLSKIMLSVDGHCMKCTWYWGSTCRHNKLWQCFCSRFRGVDSVWGQIWPILFDQMTRYHGHLQSSAPCYELWVAQYWQLFHLDFLWFPEVRRSPCSIVIGRVPVLTSNRLYQKGRFSTVANWCNSLFNLHASCHDDEDWGPYIPVGPELLQLITISSRVTEINKKVQQSWQTSALAMHLPLARLVSMPVIFAYF